MPPDYTEREKEIFEQAIQFTIIFLNNKNVIKEKYSNLGLIKAVKQELEKL